MVQAFPEASRLLFTLRKAGPEFAGVRVGKGVWQGGEEAGRLLGAEGTLAA